MRLSHLAICVSLLGLAVPTWGQDVVNVPTSLAMAKATKKVVPEVPSMARQLHLKGEQEVAVTVSPSGDVEDASVLKGNAIFTNTSLNAVKQWKFTPHVIDGKPVKMKTTIVFNYTY